MIQDDRDEIKCQAFFSIPVDAKITLEHLWGQDGSKTNGAGCLMGFVMAYTSENSHGPGSNGTLKDCLPLQTSGVQRFFVSFQWATCVASAIHWIIYIILMMWDKDQRYTLPSFIPSLTL